MNTRETIIQEAKTKLKQILNESSREAAELVDKYKMPKVYKKADSSYIYGAASNHDENIGTGEAYTLGNMLKSAGRAGLIFGAAGLGASGARYMAGHTHDASDVLSTTGTGLAIGALVGATIGPALSYYAGKNTENTRLSIYNYKHKDSEEDGNKDENKQQTDQDKTTGASNNGMNSGMSNGGMGNGMNGGMGRGMGNGMNGGMGRGMGNGMNGGMGRGMGNGMNGGMGRGMGNRTV